MRPCLGTLQNKLHEVNCQDLLPSRASASLCNLKESAAANQRVFVKADELLWLRAGGKSRTRSNTLANIHRVHELLCSRLEGNGGSGLDCRLLATRKMWGHIWSALKRLQQSSRTQAGPFLRYVITAASANTGNGSLYLSCAPIYELQLLMSLCSKGASGCHSHPGYCDGVELVASLYNELHMLDAGSSLLVQPVQI